MFIIIINYNLYEQLNFEIILLVNTEISSCSQALLLSKPRDQGGSVPSKRSAEIRPFFEHRGESS